MALASLSHRLMCVPSNALMLVFFVRSCVQFESYVHERLSKILLYVISVSRLMNVLFHSHKHHCIVHIWPASHEKGPSDISHSVDLDQPYTMLKTPIRNQIVYTARNICVIDVTSVKKCRP